MLKNNTRILHLEVGRWRTRKHSKSREHDDSHEVKEAILKEVRLLCREKGERPFENQVGENPDIGIENGIIILKGRGKFKNKTFITNGIALDDYFVLKFVPYGDENEIQLLIPDNSKINGNTGELKIFQEYKHFYVIPKIDEVAVLLVEHLLAELNSNDIQLDEEAIIIFE